MVHNQLYCDLCNSEVLAALVKTHNYLYLCYYKHNIKHDYISCFCFFSPDTCLKKCKDDEMMFETIQMFKNGGFMH